jgi:hypothetical protein
VNGDRLARAQHFDEPPDQFGNRLTRGRDTAIRDREGVKGESAGGRRSMFTGKAELDRLITRQERYDNIDPRPTPRASLIVEPLRAAGSRDDTQTSLPWAGYPEDVRRHAIILSLRV